MLELPEAVCVSRQLIETVTGKKIADVIAAFSPNKFAWYSGDPQEYPDMLRGKTIGESGSCGGMVVIPAGNYRLVFSEGVNLRFLKPGEKQPKKHQLLLTFTDGTVLYAFVQMYGGLLCFEEGKVVNPYYRAAKKKPSPLSDAFDETYWTALWGGETKNISVKAILATEQRIPGLGNGVLQDILFHAKIHPKRKIDTLNESGKIMLYRSLKNTLKKMVENGARDTEKDLFGKPGGYTTVLSKNTVGKPCPDCGAEIKKANYMGGSVYFCPSCQRENEYS